MLDAPTIAAGCKVDIAKPLNALGSGVMASMQSQAVLIACVMGRRLQRMDDVSGSRQREWATDILESVPSILFLALWQSNASMELVGWIGAALAAMVLIGFRVFRVRYNPILLGINVHLLIITPLIVTVFHLGARELGQTLVAFGHRGVLVTIFLVGCLLTVFSRHGFVGVEGLPASSRRVYSSILLAASIGAIAWSFSYSGGGLLGIAVPIMALFGLRRLLIARWIDSSQIRGAAAAAGGAVLAADFASEAR